MRRETKETVRVIGLAVAGMLLVATSFRLWRACCPPSFLETPSLMASLDQAAAERSLVLLQTPLAKWRPSERLDSEPEMAAWLESQSRVVLPWEWSEEARTKDVSGYLASWDRTLGAFAESYDRECADQDREGRRLLALLQDEDRLYAHATNQVNALVAQLAADAFPVEIRLETLAKGRWWGWNRDAFQVSVTNAEQGAALLAERTADASDRRRALDELTARIAESDMLQVRLADRRDALSAARARAASMTELDEAARAATVRDLLREIVSCLHFRRNQP